MLVVCCFLKVWVFFVLQNKMKKILRYAMPHVQLTKHKPRLEEENNTNDDDDATNEYDEEYTSRPRVLNKGNVNLQEGACNRNLETNYEDDVNEHTPLLQWTHLMELLIVLYCFHLAGEGTSDKRLECCKFWLLFCQLLLKVLCNKHLYQIIWYLLVFILL